MKRGPRSHGFTLMELVVVMGILSGFLVMLVQFVGTGVELFDEGETGQAMADRAESARTIVDRELRRLSADGRWLEPGRPGDRLVVQQLPLGLPAPLAPGGPVLRAGVQLEPMLEEHMIEAAVMQRAIQELGTDADPGEIEARTEELLVGASLRGRGRIMMVPWPQTERNVEVQSKEVTHIELRLGRFLMDERLRVGEDLIDPFDVPAPGSNELPATVVHAATEVLVDNLLYFGIDMWSQLTTGWDGIGERGPQRVWDSARGGWLKEPAVGPEFYFDLGSWSLPDPTDDIHPRALRVTLVVAADESAPPEGLLATSLAADGRALWLGEGERFPGASDGGYCKLGGEWVRYRERRGDSLVGLSRAQRGTRRGEHRAGSIVRVGRTVEFVVPLAHARDDWNHSDG